MSAVNNIVQNTFSRVFNSSISIRRYLLHVVLYLHVIVSDKLFYFLID